MNIHGHLLRFDVTKGYNSAYTQQVALKHRSLYAATDNILTLVY